MNPRTRPDVPTGTAEVRVLGTLRARRTDGTMVQPRDWRTGQTADLLRLLALHVDEPVPVDILLEALWPNVDEKRGRASLRSAASRIRTALGEGCVVRRLGGLVLTNAWVDAHAFTALAREARRHVVTGALAQAVTTTREAESLYLDEFRAHHDGADWALAERATLAATYRQMLADAADAAVSLSWWYDAVDLAQRSLAADPLSERGYRALMRGYRGLGETSRALQVYERCRRTLADEVGADPSPSTQALHLELLSDEPVEAPPPPFCGRVHERSWLRQVTDRPAASGRPEVVLVHGPAGSGVSRLLDETWAVGTASATRLTASSDRDVVTELRAAVAEQGTRSAAASGEPVVVVVDDAGALDGAALERMADVLRGLRGAVSVVVAGRTSVSGFPTTLQQALAPALASRLSVLSLGRLAEEEVAQLCRGVLQGQVSEALTEAVVDQTGGVPGRVVDLVRGWASSGRVAATSAGLVVLQAGRADVRTTVRQQLASAVDRLSNAELEVLQLVGVLGRPAPRDLLLPLFVMEGEAPSEGDRQELQQALDRLSDLKLLTSSDAGYAPRDPLLNDALLTWMRPSSLRRLHRRVAEQALIPASERVEHWLEAAEPQLAMAAALDAIDEAMATGRYEIARRHLRQLCQAPAMADADPSDRMELFERLGDVSSLLGRVHEATEAYAVAVEAARAGARPELSRLEEKRASVGRPASLRVEAGAPGAQALAATGSPGAGAAGVAAPPTTAASWSDAGRAGSADAELAGWPDEDDAELAELLPGLAGLERDLLSDLGGSSDLVDDTADPDGGAADLERPRTAHDLPGATPALLPPTVRPGTPPTPEVAARLHDDVLDADADGDPGVRAAARAVLIRTVLVPRREFRESRRWALDGMAITRDPARRVELLVADLLPGAVLGNGRVVEPLLHHAARLADADGVADDAVADLAVLRALVAHDLGRADAGALLGAAEATGTCGPGGSHAWLLVRTAVERGDLELAERADLAPTPDTAPPALRQLRGCASAALAVELGRPDDARERLLDVLEIAERTEASIAVPEAATRLVELEAPHDLSSARRRFELFEWAAGGESWLPRETVLRLMARAAVRAADDRPDDAASAAAAAADTAESTGLVHLAAAAHRRRAGYLSRAGRPSDARLATAAAARWREMARQGVPETPLVDDHAVLPGGARRTRVPRQDGARVHRERRDDPPEPARR